MEVSFINQLAGKREYLEHEMTIEKQITFPNLE